MRKIIVVLGATGFIGRNILAELQKEEINTIAVVRSSRKAEQTGIQKFILWSNVES